MEGIEGRWEGEREVVNCGVIDVSLTEGNNTFEGLPPFVDATKTNPGVSSLPGIGSADPAAASNRTSDSVRNANPSTPRFAKGVAFAVPWGTMLPPLNRMSPPALAITPVSRLREVFVSRVVVWFISAQAVSGKISARSTPATRRGDM